MIHGLELPIQAHDLIKAYQTLVHFRDIYHDITDGNYHLVVKHRIVSELRHLIIL